MFSLNLGKNRNIKDRISFQRYKKRSKLQCKLENTFPTQHDYKERNNYKILRIELCTPEKYSFKLQMAIPQLVCLVAIRKGGSSKCQRLYKD